MTWKGVGPIQAEAAPKVGQDHRAAEAGLPLGHRVGLLLATVGAQDGGGERAGLVGSLLH